jgi:hypothetical protein
LDFGIRPSRFWQWDFWLSFRRTVRNDAKLSRDKFRTYLRDDAAILQTNQSNEDEKQHALTKSADLKKQTMMLHRSFLLLAFSALATAFTTRSNAFLGSSVR